MLIPRSRSLSKMFASTAIVLALTSISALAGCGTQTVIYKEVPEYYLTKGLVPERYVREDGAVVIHRARQFDGVVLPGEEESGRTEQDDGEVTLRAYTPEQLIGIFTKSILDEEYDLLWEQMVSDRVKSEYETDEQGRAEFTDFLARNRDELYGMFNRLSAQMYTPYVISEDGPLGGVRVRFHATVAKDFQFAAVDMVYEDQDLKLLMIHPYHRAPVEGAEGEEPGG